MGSYIKVIAPLFLGPKKQRPTEKQERTEKKTNLILLEITNGEIMLSPEPAEETRVRSRHGSPRGVCAAAAWA